MISNMRFQLVLLLAAAAVLFAACGGGADESSAFGGFAPPPPAAPAPAAAPTREEAFDVGSAAGVPAPPAAPAPRPAAPAAALAPPKLVAGGELGDIAVVSDEAAAALALQQRIIIRTVNMGLVVADISLSLDNIEKLAVELGGWKVSSDRFQKHAGSISIRVPAERLDEAVGRMREMAVEVESERSNSQDVTEEYFDITARRDSLLAERDVYTKLFEDAEKVEDALQVREALTRIQGDVESLQGRINRLDLSSSFSLINVSLSLEPAEMTVDAGTDQTAGVGQVVRFRAFFKPPEGIEDFVFTWDFGDGSRVVTSYRTAPTEDEDTRVTATQTHQYHDERDSPFFAKVTITGTGDAGLAEGEDTLTVTVSKIPTIEIFAGENATVEEDQEVQLTGSFTRPEGLSEVRFKWDFGDGTPAVTGEIAEDVTNAVTTHVYPDHRPFSFTATLTITAQSEAGEVEGFSTVQVQVTEVRGWAIAGWSASGQGKTAVRALSGVGQVAVSVLIWAAIFSPIWGLVGVGGFLGWRRLRTARSHRRESATATP